MIIIIIDDTEEFLNQMAKMFASGEDISKILAIKCGIDEIDSSHNYPEKIEYEEIKCEEDLLRDSFIEKIRNYISSDIDARILIDITLSNKQMAEANKNREPYNFSEFSSVLLADKLVNNLVVQTRQIFFYTRPDAIGFIKEKFIENTKRKWWAPLARPGFTGRDESMYKSYFIKKVMK